MIWSVSTLFLSSGHTRPLAKISLMMAPYKLDTSTNLPAIAAAAEQQAAPDPQAEYLAAASSKEAALAQKATADTQKTLAEVEKTNAQTAEIMAKLGGELGGMPA